MNDRHARRTGWLGALLAFALAVPVAALTAFLVFEALKAGGPGGERPRTLLGIYDPPSPSVPALPVAIYGPDEEGPPLPTLGYDEIVALSSPDPAASTPGPGTTPLPGGPAPTDVPPSAGVTTTADETPATDTPVATGSPGDTGSAAPTDSSTRAPAAPLIDVDLRPAAIAVASDLCMLHARVPGCPDGILGTIIDSLPPPPDFGSPDEFGFGDFALSALVNRDPGAPEYAEFGEGGCAPPGDGGVSLLILTTEVAQYDLIYWPLLYLPDGSMEPSEILGMDSGNTIFERSAVPYRYYHCPRLRVGEEILFAVSIRLTDAEGNVAWPPTYEFCLDCRTPPAGERLALSSGYAVGLHPTWAEGILYSPPADGALEFAYRLPGGRWRSQLALSVRRHEEARVRTPPTLLPGTRYEYQFRLWPADGGPIYESPISSFGTLRRTIIVEASRFEVVDEGSGELATISLELCGDLLTDPTTLTVLGDCSHVIQAFSTRGELGIDGRRTIEGGLATGYLDIHDGERVIAEFDPPSIQLTDTRANFLRVELWSSDGDDDCSFDCTWWVFFEIPPYFGSGLRACVEGETSFVLRTSPTARGFEPIEAYFVNSVGGPQVRPTQLNVCVMETH